MFYLKNPFPDPLKLIPAYNVCIRNVQQMPLLPYWPYDSGLAPLGKIKLNCPALLKCTRFTIVWW